MEEETKEINPYLSEKIDTLFFNDKGLKTPYEETYEEVFGKPMTTNRSNINLGSYINGISKEEANTMEPDVYKNGEVVSGPSLHKKDEQVTESSETNENGDATTNESNVRDNLVEQIKADMTMEEFFNKVNEGIVNDKVYKRLNVNVTGTGKLVVPENDEHDNETMQEEQVHEGEKIEPVVLQENSRTRRNKS